MVGHSVSFQDTRKMNFGHKFVFRNGLQIRRIVSKRSLPPFNFQASLLQSGSRESSNPWPSSRIGAFHSCSRYTSAATETSPHSADDLFEQKQREKAESAAQKDQGNHNKGNEPSLDELVSTLENLQQENQKLQDSMKELQEMNKSSLDKYRLALADTENLRKRMERQVSDAKEYGIQSFCKDLLEVPDILRAAIESVSDDSILEENKTLKDMHEGLKMTESVLLKVFEKHGLVKIDPLGEKFDPNFHEAMFRIPADAEKKPDTVGAVAKVGYSLHGRPVRAAQVGVVQK